MGNEVEVQVRCTLGERFDKYEGPQKERWRIINPFCLTLIQDFLRQLI